MGAILCCDSDKLTDQSELTVCDRKLSGIDRPISESLLSQVKTCAIVYATSESFLAKVAFEIK